MRFLVTHFQQFLTKIGHKWYAYGHILKTTNDYETNKPILDRKKVWLALGIDNLTKVFNEKRRHSKNLKTNASTQVKNKKYAPI